MKITKKRSILFFVLLFFFFSASLEMVDKTDDVNRKIQKSLTSEIAKVLDVGTYAVFVNASLEEKIDDQKKENTPSENPSDTNLNLEGLDPNSENSINDVLNGGGSISARERANTSRLADLPGFEFDPGIKTPIFEKPKEYTISGLEITVLYDQSIPQGNIASLQQALQNKIQLGYGGIGKLSFYPADLKKNIQAAVPNQPQPQVQPPAKETALDKLANFILNNFWLILAILMLSILFFLIIILLFFFLLSKKKNENNEVNNTKKETEMPEEGKKKEPLKNDYKLKDPKGYENTINLDEDHWRKIRIEKESELVEQFSKDPLLGRKFFSSLRQEQKNEIMNAFSPSIRGLFSPFTAYTEEENIDKTMAEKYKKEAGLFEQYNRELNLFRQAAGLQIRGLFGRLSFLDSFELKNILDTLTIEELAYITDFLPRENVRKVLQSFSEEKRKALLNYSGKKLTKENIENLSFKINRNIDEIANSILFPKTQKDEIYDIIFSESTNSKDLFKSLEENSELSEKFKKYNITFDDFLKEKNQDIISGTFDDLENEEVALSLLSMREEDRNKYKEMLNSNRRGVIEDMMLSYHPIDDRDKIQNGKFKLVDRYRQLRSLR